MKRNETDLWIEEIMKAVAETEQAANENKYDGFDFDNTRYFDTYAESKEAYVY